MQLELGPIEREVLQETLRAHLTELGTQIHHAARFGEVTVLPPGMVTRIHAFKRRLRTRQQVIETLLGRLEGRERARQPLPGQAEGRG